MQLTTFSDYSMRVLIYLGLQRDKLATIAEIARAYEVSENHLMKVVHNLAQRGYIETVRGKGGGMRLAKPAQDINLADMVRMTEGGAGLLHCLDQQGTCCIQTACQLTGILREAQEAMYATLGKYSLADLLREQRPLASILHRVSPPAIPQD
jgi:Rrf2 family nitric oxide-sensitive transcriptional repressor